MAIKWVEYICTNCDGTGKARSIAGDEELPCPVCGGSGTILIPEEEDEDE